MASPGRIPCEVPHCARTAKGDASRNWWICGDHWKPVPKWMRKVLRSAQRARNKTLQYTTWRQIRQAAIEAAAGIG